MTMKTTSQTKYKQRHLLFRTGVINTLINLNTSSFVNRFVSICRRLKDRLKEAPLKAGECDFLLYLLLMPLLELNTLTMLDSLSNNNNECNNYLLTLIEQPPHKSSLQKILYS